MPTHDLKKRKRIHTKKRPYPCEVCGKILFNLTIHTRTHTGEKPYPCNEIGCGKRFARKDDLIVHTRTHTGEKPYPCDGIGCEERFATITERRVHKRRRHTGEKLHPCDEIECNKRFTTKWELTTHKRSAAHRSDQIIEGGSSDDEIFDRPRSPRQQECPEQTAESGLESWLLGCSSPPSSISTVPSPVSHHSSPPSTISAGPSPVPKRSSPHPTIPSTFLSEDASVEEQRNTQDSRARRNQSAVSQRSSGCPNRKGVRPTSRLLQDQRLKNYKMPWNQDYHEPCDHLGRCEDNDDCECAKSKGGCSHGCACFGNCDITLLPCRCKTQQACTNCSCGNSSRECSEDCGCGGCPQFKVKENLLFRIRPSTLPGAGNGLFLRVDVSRGDCLGEYQGDIVPIGSEPDRKRMYCIDVARDSTIAASSQCVVFFINEHCPDQRPNVKFSCIFASKNCTWVVRVFALRDIPCGSELLVDYHSKGSLKARSQAHRPLHDFIRTEIGCSSNSGDKLYVGDFVRLTPDHGEVEIARVVGYDVPDNGKIMITQTLKLDGQEILETNELALISVRKISSTVNVRSYKKSDILFYNRKYDCISNTILPRGRCLDYSQTVQRMDVVKLKQNLNALHHSTRDNSGANSVNKDGLFAVKDILKENRNQYFVQWDGLDPTTGKDYDASWIPKSYANKSLVKSWKRLKGRKL